MVLCSYTINSILLEICVVIWAEATILIVVLLKKETNIVSLL